MTWRHNRVCHANPSRSVSKLVFASIPLQTVGAPAKGSKVVSSSPERTARKAQQPPKAQWLPLPCRATWWRLRLPSCLLSVLPPRLQSPAPSARIPQQPPCKSPVQEVEQLPRDFFLHLLQCRFPPRDAGGWPHVLGAPGHLRASRVF